MSEQDRVMACPVCGTPVLHSCHHEDKGDVRSVEMQIGTAIELMDDWIDHLKEQVSEAEESRQQLVASMMDWE